MADWTRQENDLIVADYFSMLNDELAGKPINKTRNRNALLALLNGRNNSAVEWKHMNISAFLSGWGMPFIRGYKPAPNKQRSLAEAILEYLRMRRVEMETRFEMFSDDQAVTEVTLDFTKFLESKPKKEVVSEPIVPFLSKPFKINYLEREQMNASLGAQGERLAIAFEKWQLNQAGHTSLADQIEWVSQNDDGAGFDILSKNIDGTDKYIEVKTTKLSKDSPFFFSKGEYNFSIKQARSYHFYRVFEFGPSPKMFIATGCFDDFCNKEAIQYKGSF